eukprot:1160403-Pelagomonas_calceolata.AAC.6
MQALAMKRSHTHAHTQHRGRPPSDHDDRDRGLRFNNGGLPIRGSRDDVPMEAPQEVYALHGDEVCPHVAAKAGK